jgi:hypothetical protein
MSSGIFGGIDLPVLALVLPLPDPIWGESIKAVISC